MGGPRARTAPNLGERPQKRGVSIVADRTTFACWLVLRQVLNVPIHNEMATTLTTVSTMES